ncbi:MAG: KpsF/GutQ family sugar-phosphate isomerase [Lentisphaeria bacterium]|jgi:arabinose-5-phosphate isomerase|nr:KpsF/GutQ family sugar-phosphate isomerase [Lentisphaeria bacterium]
MSDRFFSRPAGAGSDKPSAVLDRARAVFDAEILGLESVRDGLGAAFEELVRLALDTLEHRGKLVCAGVGKSGHIGQKLAATLSSTGSRAAFLHPVEAMHGDLGILAEPDILLALSYSGETDELLAVLPAVKRLGAKIVAITGDPASRLAKWADLVVPMPVPREACPFNLAPTVSTTALLALGDALAMVLLECRRFELDDYAKLHPAGAIGRSICLGVADIMRRDEAFPTVAPGCPVREVLMAMTRARSGSVAVVADDRTLLGIFTDGDFRRHIVANPQLLDCAIQTVMTANPITVNRNALAVELVRILEHRKIDDIIVVDDENHAVGLVDIQDLPRFKVM